tara:strand:+ start:1547 stop:1753 length:207 start_codon:yes stop_codon:yes gene_type:complete
MGIVLIILFYCFDDWLANLVGNPYVGDVPLALIAFVWILMEVFVLRGFYTWLTVMRANAAAQNGLNRF